MLTVETIRKIRLAVHREGKSIRKTAKDLHLSRNTIRKVIRSDQTAFEYKRQVQPHLRLQQSVFRPFPPSSETVTVLGCGLSKVSDNTAYED